MVRRILITGASGFLGSYLLRKIPPDIKVMAQYNSTQPITAIRNIQTIKLNFENPDLQVLQRFSPDVIIHAGAWTRIDDCEQNPSLSKRVNVDFTTKLSRLASDIKARMIFLSTDQVFDGTNPPYSEKSSVNPLNIYARHKLSAERMVLQTVENSVVARSALIYGKALHQKPTFTEKMYVSLKNNQPVKVELTENSFCGVIHLGGSERVSRFQMGEKMCDLFGLNKKILVPVQMASNYLPAKRAADLSFNIKLAQSVLKTTFDEVTTGLLKAFSN